MANTNSAQIAKVVATPVEHVKVNEWGGRLRYAFFSVAAVPTGAGDTMTLCRIPAGARIVGGKFVFSVAQGATATTAIGIAGTAAKYRTAAITNALTEFLIASTVAENYGLELTAGETIIATNAAAVWTAASFSGHIAYLVD
jgi:hypothetical protein